MGRGLGSGQGWGSHASHFASRVSHHMAQICENGFRRGATIGQSGGWGGCASAGAAKTSRLGQHPGSTTE